VRQRGSVASATLKVQRSRTEGSTTRLRSNSNLTTGSVVEDEEVVHAVEPRARTAMLPPVMVSGLEDFLYGPVLSRGMLTGIFLRRPKASTSIRCAGWVSRKIASLLRATTVSANFSLMDYLKVRVDKVLSSMA
jgi:hypothetical protein